MMALASVAAGLWLASSAASRELFPPRGVGMSDSRLGFFFIDSKEELVGITIGQLFSGEAEWAEKFMQLVYAAIND
jgi:hypothetical protein